MSQVGYQQLFSLAPLAVLFCTSIITILPSPPEIFAAPNRRSLATCLLYQNMSLCLIDHISFRCPKIGRKLSLSLIDMINNH